MSILRNDSIQTAAPKSTDSRYDNDGLGYSSIGDVNTSIVASRRYIGLTVNISGTEYWYNGGIADGDLVTKLTSGISNILDGGDNEILLGDGGTVGDLTITGNSSGTNADIILTPQGTGTFKIQGNHQANISDADDVLTKGYGDNAYVSSLSGYTQTTEDEVVTGSWSFSDVTISGTLTITGSTVAVDSEITTADSVIDLNDGEAGSGVTLGYSGLRVDRGSAANDFWFGFDEERDAFTVGLVNPTLFTTEIAGTDIVATREDNPLAGGIAKWDSVNDRLTFVSAESIGGGSPVNYGSTNQIPYSNGTAFLYTSNLAFDGDKLSLVDLDIDNINIDGNTINSTTGNLNLSSTSGIISVSSDVSFGTNTIYNDSNAIILNGSTGTLKAGASTLSTLTLTTGETVNEISSDTTLSDSSNTSIPTENSVKTYVDNIFEEGTYSPVFTHISNLSSTPQKKFGDFHYIRVLDTVTVWGVIDVNIFQTGGRTSFSMSLPISSNFTNDISECSGSASAEYTLFSVDNVDSCSVKLNSGNPSRPIIFRWLSSSNNEANVTFTLNYKVLS